ncbi:MAG: proton-conducting transporter membrane subunit [Bacteroidota bacterium]
MNSLIHTLLLIPFCGFLLSLFLPKENENFISRVSFFTMGAQLALAVLLVTLWIFNGCESVNIRDVSLYESKGYNFFLDFYFDKITVVYLLVGALLTFMVTIYSRYYLHREKDYKRFFSIILFFYGGYNLVIFSGNLETMFIGWEILGISSFLLIAFYRDRYLPVKNAVKVFSIYRIADIGMILAMWLSHHLWHENITFSKLQNYELVHEHLSQHSLTGAFVSLMILICAAAKSAQLPFSYWLPRAMEGPTPSSAIFYGSLSVHIGAFILMRTFPFWEHQISIRILIAVLGLSTSVIATGVARVQSSVKSQIAWSSISQIGLIFIEIAAGLETLALIHFAGNAFLRTYQLLVSPSVVSYLIREQFYNFKPRPDTIEDSFPKKVQYTLYMLSLKEWNLDSFMYRYAWNPVKWLGKKMNFLTLKSVFLFFLPVYIIGFVLLEFGRIIPAETWQLFPVIFGFTGLVLVIKSFTERINVTLSWMLIILNHLFIALAVSFNEHFTNEHILMYLGGIMLSGIIGYLSLIRLRSFETINLNRFHGHSYEHPKIAFVFLLACLGLSGFPITPAFIGEDLIFSHVHEKQWLLAFFIAVSLILDGLAIIRIYARVFMGPHVKNYHEVAFRSS